MLFNSSQKFLYESDNDEVDVSNENNKIIKLKTTIVIFSHNLHESMAKSLSKAGQLDGQNFETFKKSVKKKRAVKDTVNIVAG
ncbi:hypothetical protein BpHYR1_020724, partial [Brachionus plicatilis]